MKKFKQNFLFYLFIFFVFDFFLYYKSKFVCKGQCGSSVCMCMCVCTLAQSCLILCSPMDCSPPAPLSMGFPRQEYWSGVGCHFLLQRIFLTQESNPCLLSLLHWQVDSLPLTPPGKPQKSQECYYLLSAYTKGMCLRISLERCDWISEFKQTFADFQPGRIPHILDWSGQVI